jgi:hypothetical protein
VFTSLTGLDHSRQQYDLFVSEFVLNEIAQGDPEAARQRLNLVSGIPVLAVNEAALRLAREIIRQAKFPRKVADDVAHIAIATVHGTDYLLTWNCAHIANPHWEARLGRIIRACGFSMPVLCTPQALLEGE